MFIEKILVATDGSDLAVRAAQVAAVLARSGGNRIVAFSVAQPHFSLNPDALPQFDVEAELRRRLDAAREHVDTVARIARRYKLGCETFTRISTTPGLEIVRAAEEHGCDLIVMGAHGPADANTLYTGSVARQVLAWSPIPVLVLRDPREAARPGLGEPPGPDTEAHGVGSPGGTPAAPSSAPDGDRDA